jgi:hypothetical protein
MDLIGELLTTLRTTAADVLPVAVFMLVFYRFVLRESLVGGVKIWIGLGLVIVGLALLLLGVDKALFPVGRMMVEQLAPAAGTHTAWAAPAWTSYGWIYVFAFLIAFAAAIAEPALLAIALKVNEISGGAIGTLGLRVAAAFGIASGVAIGCIRIATGIPLHWCVAGTLMIIAVQTVFAPRTIVPLAYDVGGVSTTAVTVPVVAALGLGLADVIPGRNALLDGFGLIALACLFATISVLAYAQTAALFERLWTRRRFDPEN